MGRNLTIPEIPDHAYAELARRASAEGESLSEFLRAHLIALVKASDLHRWIAEARAEADRSGVALQMEDFVEASDAHRR